jgi:hypothetical protein
MSRIVTGILIYHRHKPIYLTLLLLNLYTLVFMFAVKFRVILYLICKKQQYKTEFRRYPLVKRNVRFVADFLTYIALG